MRLALTLLGAGALVCLLVWTEARSGALVCLALGLVGWAVSRTGSAYLATIFARELARLSFAAPRIGAAITDAELEPLPPNVRRYLRFMGVVGRPRDWSLRVRLTGRFRLNRGDWLKCEVLQYDTRVPQPTRCFCMRLSLKGLLPVTVRDSYFAGHGVMHAQAFDAITVAHGAGPELDIGELVTYLNDAILFAPSLLLGPEVTWNEVDSSSFDVTLRDGPLSVTARVWVDEAGAPRDFSTTDRFFDTPDGKRVRTEWRTPVSSFQDVDGRKVLKQAQAIWTLPDGPFAYADFVVDPSEFWCNLRPEQAARSLRAPRSGGAPLTLDDSRDVEGYRAHPRSSPETRSNAE